MRYSLSIFLVVFCIFCAFSGQASETIKIGCLVSLDDEQSKGAAIAEALEKATSLINAKGGLASMPLEIIVRDVQHDRSRLLHEAHVLARDLNVLAIIGPSDEGLAPALRDYAESYSVPIFLTEGGDLLTAFVDKPGHDWTYSLLPDITAQSRILFDQLAALGVKRITPVLGSDDWSKSTLIVLKAYGVEKGINLSSSVRLEDRGNNAADKAAATWGAGSASKAALVWGNKKAVNDFMDTMNPDASPGWTFALPLSSLNAGTIEKWPVKKWRLFSVLPPVLARWEHQADSVGSHPSDFALMRFKANMPDSFASLPIEARLAAATAWDSLFLITQLAQSQPVISRSAIKNALLNMTAPFNGVTACLTPSQPAGAKPLLSSDSLLFVRWDGHRWLKPGEQSDLRLPSF